MSRLEDLIRELCPDGVKKISLGEMEKKHIIELGRGKVIRKKTLAEKPGNYPVYSSSALGEGLFGYYGEYMFSDERITWSIDGGGKFFYRHPHRYSVTNVSGWLKVHDSSILSIQYLFYTLDNEWSKKHFDYIKKAHPSVIREEYLVPVPPLPVQREIVRILDQFTELTAELTAELEKRKLQYEYYRIL